MQLAGIVLCGGRSSRMGRPKAWLPFGGEPLLARVVSRVASSASPVVVVAAPDQDVPALPEDVEIVRDAEEHRGPLAGLHAGLAHLADRCDAVYLSSCDVPFLRPAFITRMGELLGDNSICVPRIGGHHHPLAAIYRVGVLDAVSRLLDEDRLRPFFLFEQVPTRIVELDDLVESDPEAESLRNLNTPEEYERAARDAGFEPWD